MASRKRRARVKAAKIGRDGKFELGERDVPDPMSPGHRYRAPMNVRESAVEHMLSRGRIDSAQGEAGNRFRRLWELAAIGRQRSADLSGGGRGGKVSDPISDELVRAGRELARAIRDLGLIRSRILVSVIGEGKLIEDVARQWSRAGGIVSGKRAEGYISGTLIDALDGLVRIWGLKGIGEPKRHAAAYRRAGEEISVNDSILASGPITSTGPANEISMGKTGEVVVTQRRGIDRGPMMMHHAGSAETAPGNRARRRTLPKIPTETTSG